MSNCDLQISESAPANKKPYLRTEQKLKKPVPYTFEIVFCRTMQPAPHTYPLEEISTQFMKITQSLSILKTPSFMT